MIYWFLVVTPLFILLLADLPDFAQEIKVYKIISLESTKLQLSKFNYYGNKYLIIKQIRTHRLFGNEIFKMVVILKWGENQNGSRPMLILVYQPALFKISVKSLQ